MGFTTTSAADSSGLSAPKVRLGLYDVSKLVYQIEDFPSAVSIAKPVPQGAVTDEEFARNVMKTIAPGKWDWSRGWSVQCQHPFLIVRAPEWVHRELATSYLGGLKTIPLDPD